MGGQGETYMISAIREILSKKLAAEDTEMKSNMVVHVLMSEDVPGSTICVGYPANELDNLEKQQSPDQMVPAQCEPVTVPVSNNVCFFSFLLGVKPLTTNRNCIQILFHDNCSYCIALSLVVWNQKIFLLHGQVTFHTHHRQYMT